MTLEGLEGTELYIAILGEIISEERNILDTPSLRQTTASTLWYRERTEKRIQALTVAISVLKGYR